MKRKMDGTTGASLEEQLFDDTDKRLGNKLKHGNALDVGQRGCNKVSAMAEQLIHKLERPKQTEASQSKQTVINLKFFMETPRFNFIAYIHVIRQRDRCLSYLKKEERTFVIFVRKEYM